MCHKCPFLTNGQSKCPDAMQPKWTMPSRVKYLPIIVMDLDTNPTKCTQANRASEELSTS